MNPLLNCLAGSVVLHAVFQDDNLAILEVLAVSLCRSSSVNVSDANRNCELNCDVQDDSFAESNPNYVYKDSTSLIYKTKDDINAIRLAVPEARVTAVLLTVKNRVINVLFVKKSKSSKNCK